jgi:ankyrin repeat protein
MESPKPNPKSVPLNLVFVILKAPCLATLYVCLAAVGVVAQGTKSEPLPTGADATTLNQSGPGEEASKKALDLALLKAAEEGKDEAVGNLLRRGANPNAEDAKGWTPLVFAAKSGHLGAARALIAKGADVNRRTSTTLGTTVLCFAVGSGNMELIQALLDQGADINGKSRNGLTPLIWTASNGKAALAEFLISKGADLNLFGLIDSRGAALNAMMAATEAGKLEMLQFLIEKGAKLEATNNMGDTTLMEVAKRDRPAEVKLLIEKGANIDATGPRGHTALIYAAYNGRTENVRLLLAGGSDPFKIATDPPNTGTIVRYTAADLARERGHTEALALLREAEVKPRPPSTVPPRTRSK